MEAVYDVAGVLFDNDLESNLSGFKGFTIDSSHGHGAYGQVFRCRHLLDGKLYAIKRIRIPDAKRPMEIHALATLDHPQIARYHQCWPGVYEVTDETSPDEFGSMSDESSLNSVGPMSDSSPHDIAGLMSDSPPDITGPMSDSPSDSDNLKPLEVGEGCYFIQMTYYPSTLERIWLSNADFDRQKAWDLVLQLSEGVAYMHDKGIIHCDLAPRNVFLNDEGNIKIGDFGLARFHPEKVDSKIYVASLKHVDHGSYRAKEILENQGVTDKVDIYSLGFIIVDLFSVTASESCRLRDDLKNMKVLPACFSNEKETVKKFLLSLVEENPSSRPSAREVVKFLASETTLKVQPFVLLVGASDHSKGVELALKSAGFKVLLNYVSTLLEAEAAVVKAADTMREKYRKGSIIILVSIGQGAIFEMDDVSELMESFSGDCLGQNIKVNAIVLSTAFSAEDPATVIENISLGQYVSVVEAINLFGYDHNHDTGQVIHIDRQLGKG